MGEGDSPLKWRELDEERESEGAGKLNRWENHRARGGALSGRGDSPLKWGELDKEGGSGVRGGEERGISQGDRRR